MPQNQETRQRRNISPRDITLEELDNHFGLTRSDEQDFFDEWQYDLPNITESEKNFLNIVKEGYINLIYYAAPLEDTVKLSVVSPLLTVANFYRKPFRITTEHPIAITSIDDNVVVEGKIDILVLQKKLWVTVIESKRSGISLEAGLPQILSYMLASPHLSKPIYGMITNGGSFIFLKLVKYNDQKAHYGLSNLYGLHNINNELYTVLAILKKLSQQTIIQT